jgi:hypothetical protein
MHSLASRSLFRQVRPQVETLEDRLAPSAGTSGLAHNSAPFIHLATTNLGIQGDPANSAIGAVAAHAKTSTGFPAPAHPFDALSLLVLLNTPAGPTPVNNNSYGLIVVLPTPPQTFRDAGGVTGFDVPSADLAEASSIRQASFWSASPEKPAETGTRPNGPGRLDEVPSVPDDPVPAPPMEVPPSSTVPNTHTPGKTPSPESSNQTQQSSLTKSRPPLRAGCVVPGVSNGIILVVLIIAWHALCQARLFKLQRRHLHGRLTNRLPDETRLRLYGPWTVGGESFSIARGPPVGETAPNKTKGQTAMSALLRFKLRSGLLACTRRRTYGR